jgi:hypothetical protein
VITTLPSGHAPSPCAGAAAPDLAMRGWWEMGGEPGRGDLTVLPKEEAEQAGNCGEEDPYFSRNGSSRIFRGIIMDTSPHTSLHSTPN